MQLSRILVACLVVAAPDFAQSLSQNPRSVTLAHIDLNSADPDAAIAFWKDVIGASAYNRDSVHGVGMIGAQIVFTRKAPTGPSSGSAIDYLGLRVPDLQPLVEKLSKTSFKSSQPKQGEDVLMIDGPDGVRIELTQDSSTYAPLEFGYIHVRTTQPGDTQLWFGNNFGARPSADDPQSSRLAGAMLMFSKGDSVMPTGGRAIDHLSFEVKDLQHFCEALSGNGVKLDPPAQSTLPSVFLTNPWGIRIQLIEASSR